MPTNERTTPENSVDNASIDALIRDGARSSKGPGTAPDHTILNAEVDATRAHLDEVVVEDAKRALDLRRLLKEHPVASAAIALGAIGVGVVGYRFVRRSLLVRIYLAVRFGRLRELFPA